MLGSSSAFGDLAELWLTELESRDISEGTKENCRDDLRVHVRPFFDDDTLGEITTGWIENFLKQQAAARTPGRRMRGRDLCRTAWQAARRAGDASSIMLTTCPSPRDADFVE